MVCDDANYVALIDTNTKNNDSHAAGVASDYVYFEGIFQRKVIRRKAATLALFVILLAV